MGREALGLMGTETKKLRAVRHFWVFGLGHTGSRGTMGGGELRKQLPEREGTKATSQVTPMGFSPIAVPDNFDLAGSGSPHLKTW